MIHNPTIKRLVYLIAYFEFPFRFGFSAHGVVPDLIALLFNLSAPNQRIAVFFFTSNILVKRNSDFLALDLLTGVGVMGDMGLLLVNPSVL